MIDQASTEAERELTVLHQDADLLVVDKPSGMVVHRGWARDRRTALDVARDLSGGPVFPLHRLDRGTSGVLLFARHPQAARDGQQALADERTVKVYWALVRGIAPEEGVIDHPVPRSPKGPRIDAVTAFRRLATFERYSLVEARPRTGRLHQVRRHLKHLSLPLIGDVRYGKGEHNRLFRKRFGLHRLALHAFRLELPGGQPSSWTAPLPASLAGPFHAMGLPTDLAQPAPASP
ncbi:MAG: pseudouridine synthase [Acidobacteriota bacterium]